MSIVIQNMGPVGEADENGLWNYELRINQEVIATFVHRRSDGLVACLLQAAVMATKAEKNTSKSMVRRIAAQKGLK